MKCPICGGDTLNDLVVKGKMTNEEYLHSCNTEQLAEWLFRFRHNYRHTLSDADKMEIEDISWWLKQPHSEVADDKTM